MVRDNKKLALVISIVLIINIICSIIVYADEKDEEDNENIIEELYNDQTTIESSISEVKNPIINSRRYTVFDRKSGLSIYGKDEEKQSAMASTTKIMTAIIVLEKCNDIEEIVTIDEKSAGVGGSRLGLKKGDRITVNDLLYGLLLKSGNDSAVALAIKTAGSIEEFANIMNLKAEELGMTHTHFVTPHGLDDPDHYTTPIELAKLTDYALKNSIFATIVKTKYAVIKVNGEQRQIKNTNEVLCGDYDGVYGVKTGFTNNAGRCLVTAVKRNNIDLIVVVLGADTRKDRASDTVKLINYVFNNYELVNIEEKAIEEFEKWKNINQDRIYIHKARNNLSSKLNKINIKEIVTKEQINIEINSINYLEAPVEENTVIGNMTIKNGDKIIEKVDIIVSKEVNKLNIWDYTKIIARCYAY